MLFFLWIVVVVVALVLYLREVYSKLSRAQVNHLPYTPVVGHLGRVLLKREHLVDTMMRTYLAFPEDKIVGQYEFINSNLVVRDLELLKKITIKDFEYFIDRRTFVDEQNDPVFGRNLLALKGNEWKDMRSALSPAFTSSKIRLMVPFMVEVGDSMIESLKKKIQDSGVGYIDVEGKDLSARYANDVIASCAFGIKVDSHTEDNEFYQMGKEITTFPFSKLIIAFLYTSLPSIMKKLNFTFLSEKPKNFFTNLVLEMIKHREENNIVRNDMINLLIEAKKGQLSHDSKDNDADAGFATVEESAVGKKLIKREWTDIDLVAQAVIFLLAGFDTISTTVAFLLHELALNPDVQDRLVQEIREYNEKNNGKIDFNTIQKMAYMDMVVSETLRKWPGGAIFDRLCVKDYNLGKPNNKATKDYILRKGEIIQIPIWAFHHDPEYFPNPNKFDPERFSEENKHNIKPFAYMPFGLGPRNCIGSRFALCEVKVMIYQLLQHMEVSPCEKTSIPTKLTKNGFLMRIEGGHWIRMKIRQ